MKKKAFTWDIKTIILILIIFIVLFYLTKGIAEYLVESGSSQTCLLSVIATANTRGSPTDTLGLECYTNFVGDMKAKGSKTKDKKDYIQRWLADLAYECWMQFGEGKYDVFEGNFFSKPAHCFICSKFNIDARTSNQLKGEHIIKQEDFIEFIKENNLPSGRSYYDFLYGGMIIQSGKQKIFIGNMDLNPDLIKKAKETFMSLFEDKKSEVSEEEMKEEFDESFEINEFDELKMLSGEGKSGYAVMYYQVSRTYFMQHWINPLSQFLYGKITGTSTQDKTVPPAYVFVVPYDQVTELQCDMLQG